MRNLFFSRNRYESDQTVSHTFYKMIQIKYYTYVFPVFSACSDVEPKRVWICKTWTIKTQFFEILIIFQILLLFWDWMCSREPIHSTYLSNAGNWIRFRFSWTGSRNRFKFLNFFLLRFYFFWSLLDRAIRIFRYIQAVWYGNTKNWNVLQFYDFSSICLPFISFLLHLHANQSFHSKIYFSFGLFGENLIFETATTYP